MAHLYSADQFSLSNQSDFRTAFRRATRSVALLNLLLDMIVLATQLVCMDQTIVTLFEGYTQRNPRESGCDGVTETQSPGLVLSAAMSLGQYHRCSSLVSPHDNN